MSQPAPQRIERDAVLAVLRAQDVIDRYQLGGRVVGDELRTKICPKCGPRSRADSVAINLLTGKWSDHAHGCVGDILDLVAGLNALDARRDFNRVLELAADIAGVGPESDPAAVYRALERRKLEEERQRQAKAEARARAQRLAREHWGNCRRRDALGERYLRLERGLDVDQLVERGLVRFAGMYGDPIVPLWSSLGAVVNVVRRAIDPGVLCPRCALGNRGVHLCNSCKTDLAGADAGPKTPGLKGCGTAGTLVGHLQQLGRGTTAVVVEGVIDSLTAALAWPNAVVLGAHGAGEYARIVGYASRFVLEREGELLLVAHNDPPRVDKQTGEQRPGVGQEAADEAMRLAIEAGLVTTGAGGEPVAHVHAVAIGGAKDLNDAYRAGWRP